KVECVAGRHTNIDACAEHAAEPSITLDFALTRTSPSPVALPPELKVLWSVAFPFWSRKKWIVGSFAVPTRRIVAVDVAEIFASINGIATETSRRLLIP